MLLKANTLYDKKEYAEAVQVYDSIDKKEKLPVVFYNKGNCFFKLGKYVDAIIYWNKALKQCFYSQRAAIIYNISAAYKKLGYTPEKTFWNRFVERLYRISSLFHYLDYSYFFYCSGFYFLVHGFGPNNGALLY